MSEEVSTVRLYLHRALYLLNLVSLGPTTWPVLIKHQGLTDPLQAVAYSFWGGLAALSALGIRYPVKMLLLVFVQLLYKSSWMLAVALPLWVDLSHRRLHPGHGIGYCLRCDRDSLAIRLDSLCQSAWRQVAG
jgi:hypothetical protein